MFKNKTNLVSKSSGEDAFILNKIQSIYRKINICPVLPSKGSSIILLLSGGLDSVSLCYFLMKEYQYRIFPLYVKRSLTDAQYNSVKHYAAFFTKEFPALFHDVRIINPIQMFSFRNVQAKKILKNPQFVMMNAVSGKNSERYRLWLTSTPTRLGHYLSTAMDYVFELKFQKSIRISSVFLGLVPEDRLARESTLTVLNAFNLAFNAVLGDYSIRFFAPFDKSSNFYLKRSYLIKYALKHRVDLSKTWSCFYYDRKKPCNKCTSCINRNELLSKKNYKKNCLKNFLGNLMNFGQQIAKNKINVKIPLTNESVVNFCKGVNEIKINKGLFIMKKNADVVELNEIGILIWNEIKNKSRTVKEIIEIVAKAYPNASKKVVEIDTKNFLETCCVYGIFSITSGS